MVALRNVGKQDSSSKHSTQTLPTGTEAHAAHCATKLICYKQGGELVFPEHRPLQGRDQTCIMGQYLDGTMHNEMPTMCFLTTVFGKVKSLGSTRGQAASRAGA